MTHSSQTQNRAEQINQPTLHGELVLLFQGVHLLAVTHFLVLSLRFLLAPQLLHLWEADGKLLKLQISCSQ